MDSSVYPISLSLDSELVEDENQKIELLVPVFPAPPPPLNADSVKNHSKTIQKAGASSVLLPYRAAPIIRGKVWMDKNGDARKMKMKDHILRLNYSSIKMVILI